MGVGVFCLCCFVVFVFFNSKANASFYSADYETLLIS